MAFKRKAEFISGPDSIPDVVKIEPNPALIDPDKTDGRRLRGLFVDFVDTCFGLVARLTANDIRGVDKKVRTLTARDAITPLTLVVGLRCVVTNNTTAAAALLGEDNGQAEYYLLRDSAGPLQAFIDAEQDTTDLVGTRWVLTSGSPAQIAASYALFDPARPQKLGDVVRFVLGGQTLLFQALTNLPTSGTVTPAPTGDPADPNWFAFQPITSNYVTPQALLDGLASRELKFVPVAANEVPPTRQGIVGLNLHRAIVWLANNAGGLGGSAPAAPTNGHADDQANIFYGTINPLDPALADYEIFYTGSGGPVSAAAGRADLVGNILTIRGLVGPNEVKTVGMRVAASGTRPASAWLYNLVAFTGPLPTPKGYQATYTDIFPERA